jgi:hypothetical protein
MRRIEIAIALCTGAFLFLWAGAWAQQAPSSPAEGSQNPGAQTPASQPSSSSTEKTGKPKKWSGKLVDAGCMTKALNTIASPAQQGASPAGPHFLGGSSEPSPLPGQHPGAGGAQQLEMPGGQPQQQPNVPIGPLGQSPSMGSNDTAQMRKAALIDDAANKCAATESTTSFGLVLGDRRVINFGEEGDSKASQAIKDVELKPGKAAKATVKGTDQANGSVQVASVEIKGKRTHATEPSPSPAGPGAR